MSYVDAELRQRAYSPRRRATLAQVQSLEHSIELLVRDCCAYEREIEAITAERDALKQKLASIYALATEDREDNNLDVHKA